MVWQLYTVMLTNFTHLLVLHAAAYISTVLLAWEITNRAKAIRMSAYLCSVAHWYKYIIAMCVVRAGIPVGVLHTLYLCVYVCGASRDSCGSVADHIPGGDHLLLPYNSRLDPQLLPPRYKVIAYLGQVPQSCLVESVHCETKYLHNCSLFSLTVPKRTPCMFMKPHSD